MPWSARTRLAGGTEHLAGVSLLRFGHDGLVLEEHDFWNQAWRGRRKPTPAGKTLRRLIEGWTGTPANVAPDEHDAIAWFARDELAGLRFAHDSYLAMFTRTFAQRRA